MSAKPTDPRCRPQCVHVIIICHGTVTVYESFQMWEKGSCHNVNF